MRRRPDTQSVVQSVVGAVLGLALLAGVLTQVPWDTVGALVGWGPPTYDEQASATHPRAEPTPAGSGTVRHSGPLRLHVGPWDRDFRVEDVSVDDDGALVPPDDVTTLGRWDGGALPGDPTGAVVLVVHRDSATQGRGPFAQLEDLPAGSRVRLDGRAYRLEEVTTYRKDELPAEEVFGQDRPECLVVVTCGGSYSETRGWDSNVVATFLPADA